MTCDQMKAILPEFQEGAISEAMRRDGESHLSRCSSCAAALAEAGRLDEFLRKAVRVPEPPADFWKTQEARALAIATSREPSWSRWKMAGAAIAAGLLVAIGFAIFSPVDSTSDKKNAALAREPLATPPPSPVSRPELKSPRILPETPATPDARPEDPRKFTFRESSENAPSFEPPRETPAPERSVATLLPGDPGYLDRLTDENVEVGLAESASDRVLGLIRAADARLNELKAAVGAKRETTAQDLASAYTMIVRDGIGGVLQDREENPSDLAAARVAARTFARWNVTALASLEPATQGGLKVAINDALRAAREISGR